MGSGLVLTRTANQHAAGLPVRLETWSLAIQGQLKAPHLKLKMRTWADECRVEAVFLSQVAQAHTRSLSVKWGVIMWALSPSVKP